MKTPTHTQYIITDNVLSFSSSSFIQSSIVPLSLSFTLVLIYPHVCIETIGPLTQRVQAEVSMNRKLYAAYYKIMCIHASSPSYVLLCNMMDMGLNANHVCYVQHPPIYFDGYCLRWVERLFMLIFCGIGCFYFLLYLNGNLNSSWHVD